MQDTLGEVKVLDKKKKPVSADERLNTFSPGQTIYSIDSAVLKRYQAQSAAQVLSQQTPVFVKSYGFNGLATLNFRGSSAAQSQVLWNGVPVSNAALSIADISLLPVAMIHKMHLVYGSSASLFGSGNVGGALWLESESPAFDSSNHYELFAAGGSYNQGSLGGKVKLNTRRISFTANMLAQTADNDFSYTDLSGKRQRTQNSALRGLSSLAQVAYLTNNKDVVRLVAWYQDYHREIPPALFESYSVKKRDDASLKLLLDWNRKRETSHYYARTSLMADDMVYEDAAISMKTDNRSSQWYTEAGWKQKIGIHHQFLVFAPVQLSWMDSSGQHKQQLKYALAAAYNFSGAGGRLSVAASGRAEVVNDNSYFLPGINAAYYLLPYLKLRANLQRTYRVSSLNELYFSPGGNSLLKPEHGWAQEAGYRIECRLSHNISLSHDVAIFNREIKDWIYWLGGAIWTPHNIATVHSRGVETQNLMTMTIDKWKWYIGINASYTRSTTEASYIPGDGSVGKQIPYTPKLTGVVNLGFEYKDFNFSYNHTYTGERYVNIDESLALYPYHTGNIHMGYFLSLKNRHRLNLSAQVNNLLNASYQIVNFRPMPGTHWLLGIGWGKN